jgi:hypothetical protein
MELKDGELRIFYKGDLDQPMDDALIKLLKLFGYRFWASGMSLRDWTRDLAFDKKEKE